MGAAAAMVGGQVVGGLLGADATRSAARTAANAQMESARLAAEQAKFKPYSISSGFGRSFFDTDKNTAGYEMDPRLKAMQDSQYGGATAIQQQLAGYDPQAMAAQVYAEQQGLMQPDRLQQDIALRQQQLQRGRIGLGLSGEAVGAGAGSGMLNPEQYSMNLARSRADAELAAKSRDYGQAYMDQLIGRGQGLFSYGMGIEEQAMKPLTIGADIGNRAAVAGANQGQALLQGGMAAAQSNLAGSMAGINAMQTGINSAAGMFSNYMNRPQTPYGNFGSGFNSSAAQYDYNRGLAGGQFTAGGYGE